MGCSPSTIGPSSATHASSRQVLTLGAAGCCGPYGCCMARFCSTLRPSLSSSASHSFRRSAGGMANGDSPSEFPSGAKRRPSQDHSPMEGGPVHLNVLRTYPAIHVEIGSGVESHQQHASPTTTTTAATAAGNATGVLPATNASSLVQSAAGAVVVEKNSMALTTPVQAADEHRLSSPLSPSRRRQQTVIFIFGGPGSLKGTLTQELADEFDFVSFSVEDIVFSYLPTKVANTVSTAVEIQELLRRDPRLVSLKWLLQMLSAKLNTSQRERFIVDIVPELSCLIRSDLYPCVEELGALMDEFASKHKVAFALHLHIANDKAILEQRGVTRRTGEKSLQETLDTSKLSVEMTSFIKGIDEADKGRLEKRLEAYQRFSAPFLHYFRKSKRLIRLELGVPDNVDLLADARRLFTDLGFTQHASSTIGRHHEHHYSSPSALPHHVLSPLTALPPRVVLFVTGEHQVEDLDLAYYRMRRVRLGDVLRRKDGLPERPGNNTGANSMRHQIRALRHYIDKKQAAKRREAANSSGAGGDSSGAAFLSENYLVILKGLNTEGLSRGGSKRLQLPGSEKVGVSLQTSATTLSPSAPPPPPTTGSTKSGFNIVLPVRVSTPAVSPPPSRRRINFMEYHSTYLDYFIRDRERRTPEVRCRMPFRAYSSPIHGEQLCLFPEAMSSKLCTRIARIFTEDDDEEEDSDEGGERQLIGGGLAGPAITFGHGE